MDKILLKQAAPNNRTSCVSHHLHCKLICAFLNQAKTLLEAMAGYAVVDLDHMMS